MASFVHHQWKGGGGVEPPLLLLLEANARFDAIMVDVIYGGIIVNSPTY